MKFRLVADEVVVDIARFGLIEHKKICLLFIIKKEAHNMQAGPAPIPVYRPSYLTDGLEFQGSLVESPANVFYQRVKASRASISAQGSGRFQFQWRSVSDNLLMSPTVMLRFRLRITSPVIWNQVMQYIAVRGVRGEVRCERTEYLRKRRCGG